MRRQTARTTSGLGFWIMLLLVGVLLIGGTGGTLWALGYFDAASVSRAGQVAYPALARPVRAFEAITRDDLIHPETRQLHVMWLPEAQTSPAMLRNLGDILGRVVGRDKQAGFVLTEADFLPKGTRPGVTAGVPPGKRSVTVTVERVPGLELLRQGDSFDLMAVLPPSKDQISNVEQAALLGGIKPPDTRAGQLARQSGVKPLVVAGRMVALTQGKSQSTGGSQGLTAPPGGSRGSRSAQDVQATVAVAPEEVVPLTEALSSEVKLYCVARSGHPDQDGTGPPTPSLEGMVPVVATARPVEAYAALRQDDLADPVTGRLNVFYFPADRVRPDWIIDFWRLAGRVVAHDLPNGALLTEADLLPLGTRPGVAAAAPPGTQVVSVAMDRIRGLRELSRGDHVTIHARLASESRPAFPLTDWASLQGGVLDPADQALENQLRTGVRTLVDDAIYLGPSRSEAKESNQKDDEDAVLAFLAVPAADAVRFSQAIGESDELMAVVHAFDQVEQKTAATDGEDFRLASHRSQPAAADARLAHDMAPFPVTARDIKAHERLTLEDFIDRATGRPRILYFPKDRVRPDWVGSLDELIDRVTTQPILRGRVVRTGDVLPPGAQTGPTAGVRAGEAGLRVNSEQVQGLGGLRPGDRFQLIRADAIPLDELGGTVVHGLTGGDAISQSEQTGGIGGSSIVDVLAPVVRLVEVGQSESVVRRRTDVVTETTTQTQLTPTGPVRVSTERLEPRTTETVVEAGVYWLALQGADVSAVIKAIAAGQRLVAMPISTVQTAAPVNFAVDATPGDAVRPRIVEHLRGAERSREVWLTPPSKTADAPAPAAVSVVPE